jgi:hypothetical protein
MSKALTVKVPVAKVIKALENKIESNAKILIENEQIEKDYPELLRKHSEGLLKSLKDYLVIDDVNYRSWTQSLSVTYKVTKDVVVPDAPSRNTKRTLGNYELEEINNALNILKMTEEEFVNASTMKAIAGYL